MDISVTNCADLWWSIYPNKYAILSNNFCIQAICGEGPKCPEVLLYVHVYWGLHKYASYLIVLYCCSANILSSERDFYSHDSDVTATKKGPR